METAQQKWMILLGQYVPLVLSNPSYAHTGCYAREDTGESGRVVKKSSYMHKNINVNNDYDRGEKKRLILELFDGGAQFNKIAENVGCSIRYLQQVLVDSGRKKLGHKMKPVIMKSLTTDKVVRRYKSIDSAARETGLTKYVVSRSCDQGGGVIRGMDCVFVYDQEAA